MSYFVKTKTVALRFCRALDCGTGFKPSRFLAYVQDG
jgi:hypothetical protein